MEDAYIESVRLMRVFMDMDPREILENADEFFTVLEGYSGCVLGHFREAI